MGELREALRQLPAAVTSEAQVIVTEYTLKAAAEIIAAYPEKTGNLKNGVQVEFQTAGYTARGIVRNRAPHAWIYENGTETTRYYHHNGTVASRGKMPPGHVFIPIAMKHRGLMKLDLVELVRSHGFHVSGAEAQSD